MYWRVPLRYYRRWDATVISYDGPNACQPPSAAGLLASGEVDAKGRAGGPALEGVGAGTCSWRVFRASGVSNVDVSGEADTDVAGTEIGMQKEFSEQNKWEGLPVVRDGGGKEG
jgi:hypothetical protein